jgi:putative RNA 2'-phosphotransferase
VLRHHPELIGIEIDAQGWVDVNMLMTKAQKFGVTIDLEMLQFIVDNNNKKRFAFNDNFDRIRARQGHSIPINLGYIQQRPPLKLYHGTALSTIEAILKDGIQKQSRQHVHLSENMETAISVGRRHGKPYVFTILSEQMFNDGYHFYLSDNGVWLTVFVPIAYIES